MGKYRENIGDQNMNEKIANRSSASMKIVAGLGSIDEYERFIQAGADEFFAGYVPYDWSRAYGTVIPLNRREVFTTHVQLGAFSELEILAEMMKYYGKPVHLTLNSFYYLPEQYAQITGLIHRCMDLGFHSFIIADLALMLYVREAGLDCEIHVSGEVGEENSPMLAMIQKWSPKRIIFHRKVPIEDMKTMIQQGHMGSAAMEYEAFALNERCQFNGAYCQSLHCDELGHICQIPYELGSLECRTGEKHLVPDDQKRQFDVSGEPDEEGYLCGASGCGLCALWHLRDAGITHLKLVGRGNHSDFMERDIRNLRQALTILEGSDTEEAYICQMKKQIFPLGCANQCYYAFTR